jgi:hypothetical protein
MRFSTWLHSGSRSDPAERRRGPAPSRRRATVCPRLEMLEDRRLPSTLTVTNTLDSGKGSLRYEIAQAEKHPANDTIVFAPSLDGQTITLTSGELDITTGLTIQGPGAGQLTISGGKNSRVFEVNASAPVVLSGLTISGGTGVASALLVNPYDGDGGGILNLSTLTLNGCVVSGNSVAGVHNGAPLSGGGIYNSGNLTLSGCTVSNNSARGTALDTTGGYGGGIYNAGTLTVSTSTLSGNFASNGFGGGIYNAGTLTVSTSTFNSNWIATPVGTYTENNIYGTYTDGGGNTFS